MPDLRGGGVNEAGKGAGNFDRSELHAQEPGVIAPMVEEVLVFDARVGVDEGAALRLEDGAYTLVGRDHVKTCIQAVVG